MDAAFAFGLVGDWFRWFMVDRRLISGKTQSQAGVGRKLRFGTGKYHSYP